MTDPSVKMSSPLGQIRIVASPAGVTHLEFLPGSTGRAKRQSPVEKTQNEILRQTLAWLAAYFHRTLSASSAPLLDLQGTPFELQVWHHLLTIPWGQTQSYGEIARAMGRPKAMRAVGQACGANPIPLLVPCHRVISVGSALGGYSAGLERKRWLLAHEGSHLG